MSGKLLKTVEHHIYLGIQIDHHLSWNPQVDYVCSKATSYRLIGFLQCNLCNSSKELKELSYKQFILATSYRICCDSLEPIPFP